MRGAALLPMLLIAAAAGSAEAPIPPVPSALRFPEATWTVPSVDGHHLDLAAGSRLFFADDSTLPLVELVVVLPAGDLLDSPEQPGVAGLTASLITRGGTEELGAQAVEEELDGLGARVSSGTGTLFVPVAISVPSWSAAPALERFFEMLATPGFEPDRVESVRANLLEGLSRRNDDPLAVLEREWAWLLYGRDHFSTRPLDADAVRAIGRDDLLAMHRLGWRPERAIVALSGDLQNGRLVRRVADLLGSWQESAGPPPAPLAWPPAAPSSGAPPGLYHAPADVPQAKVMLGHRLTEPIDLEDRFALDLMREVLGGSGAISRIQGRLRSAEGLVYRSSAELEAGDYWPGELRVFFEARGDNVGRALAAAVEEIRRIRDTPVDPRELAVARRNLLANLRRSFDTASEVAGYLAENALHDRPTDYWQRYRAGIEATTVDAIRRVAGRYLRPDALTVLIVGRWQEICPPTASPPAPCPVEQVAGHPVQHLPARDPLTLEAIEPRDTP